jgi:hypothetical protein
MPRPRHASSHVNDTAPMTMALRCATSAPIATTSGSIFWKDTSRDVFVNIFQKRARKQKIRENGLRATPTVSRFLFPISRCLAAPKMILGGKKTTHLQEFAIFYLPKSKLGPTSWFFAAGTRFRVVPFAGSRAPPLHCVPRAVSSRVWIIAAGLVVHRPCTSEGAAPGTRTGHQDVGGGHQSVAVSHQGFSGGLHEVAASTSPRFVRVHQ